MEELSFQSMGILEYPVKNRSESYEKPCRIRFSVNVRASAADSAPWEKAPAETDAGAYLKKHMPRFMKEAFDEVWGGAVPLLSLGRPEPLFEPLGRILGAELPVFGLAFRSLSLGSFALNAGDEAALRSRETPLSQAEAEEIRRHIITDVCDGAPANAPGTNAEKKPSPAAAGPWDCEGCGTKHLKSRFCPECGTPAPWLLGSEAGRSGER